MICGWRETDATVRAAWWVLVDDTCYQKQPLAVCGGSRRGGLGQTHGRVLNGGGKKGFEQHHKVQEK